MKYNKPTHFRMKIYVVEKDRQFRDMMGSYLLDNSEYEVHTFYDSESLLKKLSENPDIVIVNCTRTEKTGQPIISKIYDYNPEIQILIICESDCHSSGIKLLKTKVYDIIIKGEGFLERLLNCVININKLRVLHSEVKELKSHITEKYEVSNAIVGDSKGMKKVLALVEKAISVQNMTVSIHGESGTGKELVARTIHFNSVRKEHPFVTVNMGAIPKELIESELFGHEEGAFHGAYSRTKGKLELAHNGTLFINEIAELEMSMQFKLFQAIQDKEITRKGSSRSIRIDTRIITATSKDLTSEVQKGKFREDLYYRLLGLPINLPPLSERENDVILLATHFLTAFCIENKIPQKKFNLEARSKLLSHNYPGNVRELNAIVELAAVMSNDQNINDEHILFSPNHVEMDIFNMDIPLREFEIKIIRHFLKRYNNNVVLVAKKLEIGKSKIYNMIKNGEL